jgi:starch synthase
MKVLFATAELAPLVRVGGLAEAASGLVRFLRKAGVDVEVVLPDYFDTPLVDATATSIGGLDWVGAPRTVVARRGGLAGFGDVTLVSFPGVVRPHPYVEMATGQGWADNDQRFFGFSAAVAKLAELRKVDVVHLNDWHTAATIAFMSARIPTVLSIHNLAYQGIASGSWLARFAEFAEFAESSPMRAEIQRAYECFGAVNPLGGAVALADRVIAVSPHYADEILLPENGYGLDSILAERGPDVLGILNGIDTDEWNPATDPYLVENYRAPSSKAKSNCRDALLNEFGLPLNSNGPVLGMVSRLVDQKGVDLLLDAAQYLHSWGASLVVLGAGDPGLAAALHQRAGQPESNVGFREGYDLGLAHRMFAGSDLYVMPSRFEPCGLAQMQAMAYGTIPVTTSVGGLVDTVIDADTDSENGNGFRSPHNSGAGLVDALHRATNAWRNPIRRKQIIANGMSHDWSWTGPAALYEAVYESLTSAKK